MITLREGRIELEEDTQEQDQDTELSENAKWYLNFFEELINSLRLDDPSQHPPSPTKTGNIYLSLPPSGAQVWISAFFLQRKGVTGVYFRLRDGSLAERLSEGLRAVKHDLLEELGGDVELSADKNGNFTAVNKRTFPDLKNPAAREEIQTYICDLLNRYVNAFRPRLERLTQGD